MTGFWVSLLIGLGYTLAAAVVAIGLIALVVFVFVLPRQDGHGWWMAGAVFLAVALIAGLMSGCAVAVIYSRTAPPARHAVEAPPPDAGIERDAGPQSGRSSGRP